MHIFCVVVYLLVVAVHGAREVSKIKISPVLGLNERLYGKGGPIQKTNSEFSVSIWVPDATKLALSLDSSIDDFAAVPRATWNLSSISVGHHSLAVYAEYPNGTIALEDTADIFVAASTISEPMPEVRGADELRTGIYYTTYQDIAAQALQNVSAAGGNVLTVEDVLRSDWATLPSIFGPFLNDSSVLWPPFIGATNGYFMHEPEKGFYCIYKRRENEAGILPDCPELEEVLSYHADVLVSSGIDFIAFDATNWGVWPSPASDLYQFRPTELVFEVWSKLRRAGHKTPDLVVWNCINGNYSLWEEYLDLYDRYPEMLMRDADGKAVFMVVNADRVYAPPEIKPPSSPPRPTISINRTSVERMIGRGNITVQFAWQAEPDPSWLGTNKTSWSYLAECVDPNVYPGRPCENQAQESVLGRVYTANMNNALDSLPFGSSGKRNGLTYKQQMERPIKEAKAVDYLFMPSFNEFPVARQADPWGITNPLMAAMGLKTNDSFRQSIFVDGWGSEKSRTVEPSTTDGGHYTDLMKSCIRIMRLSAAGWQVSSTVGQPCNIQGEMCCEYDPIEYLSLIWSFSQYADGTGRSVLTNDLAEAEQFNKTYIQMCNTYGSYQHICSNLSSYWNKPYLPAVRGPFLLLSNTTDRSSLQIPLVEVRRCRQTTSDEYSFAVQPQTCTDQAGFQTDILLGYAVADRQSGSAFPRALRRCGTAHRLDTACSAVEEGEADILGFVF